MRQVLMAANGKSEIFRHRLPPTLNTLNIRILIESVVNLNEVEDFRIRLQRRLIRNLKVSPTARPDEKLSQLIHYPRPTLAEIYSLI
jgi:hypothetical protein